MNVRELIDYLSEQDPDLDVELALVSPVGADDDDIDVDRYSVEALFPCPVEDDDGNEIVVIWLVGGEPDDVEAFIDAVDAGALDDHDHDDES